MAATYRAEIEIGAPAELVWEILADLDSYPEWNPFTPTIETSYEIGTTISIGVSFDGKPPFERREVLRRWEPGEELRWNMTIGPRWLFRAERFQRVEVLGESRCRYVTEDAFAGLISPIVQLLYGGRVQRGFDAVAKALERRAMELMREHNAQRAQPARNMPPARA